MEIAYMKITVPVRLTEEDIVASACEYSNVKVHASQNKTIIIRIIILLFCAFNAVCLILLGLFSVLFGGGISTKTAIFIGVLFTLNFAYCMRVLLLPKILKGNTIKIMLRNFRKDCSSQMLHTYVLSAEGITDKSSTENNILQWGEIYHLTEYASCFVIEYSSSKSKVIPRRCFQNEQQLRDFRSIVSSNIPAEKWSLKGIPLGHSKPDIKTDESIDDEVHYLDQKDSLFSITYQIDEKEALALGFSIFRLSSNFKKMIVFSALQFGILIWLFFDSPLSLGVIILFEAIFILFSFFIYRNNILKSIRTDKTIGLEETASFFSDRLVTKAKNGQTEHFWNTIHQIKITRAGLLIYLHPGLAVIFPARAIESMPDKYEFKAFLKSRDIARSNRSQISK